MKEAITLKEVLEVVFKIYKTIFLTILWVFLTISSLWIAGATYQKILGEKLIPLTNGIYFKSSGNRKLYNENREELLDRAILLQAKIEGDYIFGEAYYRVQAIEGQKTSFKQHNCINPNLPCTREVWFFLYKAGDMQAQMFEFVENWRSALAQNNLPLPDDSTWAEYEKYDIPKGAIHKKYIARIIE